MSPSSYRLHISVVWGLCEYWPIFYSATKENPIWGGNSTHLLWSLAPFHAGVQSLCQVCFAPSGCVWGQLDLSQTLWDRTVVLAFFPDAVTVGSLTLRWHRPGPNWYHHSWKFAAADCPTCLHYSHMENIPWTIYDICPWILFSCFLVYLLSILRICPEEEYFFSF